MLETINRQNYLKVMLAIALPIMLQSLLGSCFGIIDQIMVGKLGDTSIAAIGLANKVPTIYSYTLGAIGTTCAILVTQYFGKKEQDNISRAVKTTLWMGICAAIIFFVICFFLPNQIMSIFSKDPEVVKVGSRYLKIVSVGIMASFLFMLMSRLFSSTGRVIIPTIISIVSLAINTLLNYCLIGGNLGFQAYGSDGAAYATVISTCIQFLLMVITFICYQTKQEFKISFKIKVSADFTKKLLKILWPIFLCELLWSLGEGVYGAIYGNIGTAEAAAMTLIGPVVILSVSLFSGLSSAASIMVGNRLGISENDFAYFLGKKTLIFAFIGTLIIGAVIVVLSNIYPNMYEISPETRKITINLLIIFACVLWVKVLNMINGGILKSGGKTYYVLALDIMGTWLIGVPAGLLASSVFGLSVEWVYLIICFEELVRLIAGLIIFKRKVWIKQI